MRLKKSGFTLIELLVVVLIIGILSAIALPQYQAAVLKSRMATLIPNVHAIVNSLEIYRLANGRYPQDDDATQSTSVLDIQISGCTLGIGGVFDCPQATYDFEDTGLVGGFLKKFYGLAYIEFAPNSTSSWGDKASRQCWADSGNTVANQVCKSMGGISRGTHYWRQEAGYKHTHNSWNTYTLP